MKIFKSERLTIFLIVFLLALVAGLYLNLVINYIFVDALKRSFMAYLVFYGNEPKLSAIGFVWPPMPTLLQLPLAVIKPLNLSGITGNILSAIFFGISAVYMNSLAVLFRVKKLFRYLILLFFVTNPLIFFYGINGMAEMIAIGFIIMTIYYFLHYVTFNRIPSLVFTSLMLSCVIMTRWEMGALLLVTLFVILCIPVFDKKYSFREAESSTVMLLIPAFFVIFLWLFSSWLIVGSPTYFLNSTYSFTSHDAQQLASNELLNQTKGNIGQSLIFSFKRVFLLAPLMIPLFIFVLFKLVNKTNRIFALTLLGFASSILLAHVFLIYTGKSYGELRYFIYSILFSFIFLLFILRDTVKLSLKKYVAVLSISIGAVVLVITSSLTFYTMSSSEYGNQEHVLIDVLLGNHDNNVSYTFDKEKKIAEYILANTNTRSVLIDDSVGFIIVYLTKNPGLFIETVDSDFEKNVKDPVSNQVKYILISNASSHSGVNVLNIVYPQMFEYGADFVTLEQDFGDWRLYKVKPDGVL